jgi:RimJ/RimL family protein N-acetyltransferase
MAMTEHRNALGQAIGRPIPDWTRRATPPPKRMVGRWCRVEPLDLDRHAAQLHEANADDVEGRNWTYIIAGPFAKLDDYRAWLEKMMNGNDLFYAIVENATDRAVGLAAYLRIDPANGSIEVGHINFSPRLQRTIAATEAMALMMRHVFDELGYRRYEWKCDSHNAPSVAAALRLGFQYEGTFRNAMVYKGRNRDSAWYSIIDGEWPAVRAAFDRWLDPSNFDENGRQRTRLGER